MKIIGVTELQRRFRPIFDEVVERKTPVVLTRGSRPEAVLLSYQEYLHLQALQSEETLAQFDRVWDRLARLNAEVDEAALAADIEAARADSHTG